MPNANHVTLMGNVTRDPQLKYTPGGTAVCEIGLAINRHWKNAAGQKQEETTFVDITFFAGGAETIQKYVKKGDPFYCEGRLQLDQWQDQQGNKRQKLKVIGDQFQLLGNKNQAGAAQNNGQQQSRPPAQQPQQQHAEFAPSDTVDFEALPW